MNSNAKGKAGEREAASVLRSLLGLSEIRRSQQYSGEGEDADLCGLPGLHVEVKRAERVQIRKWMEQAVNDHAAEAVPMVMHRSNRADWLITIRAEDLVAFATAVYLTKASE